MTAGKLRIQEMYAKGFDIKEIAEETNYSTGYVYSTLRLKDMIEPKKGKKILITTEKVLQTLERGLNYGFTNTMEGIIVDYIRQQEYLLDLYRQNYGVSMKSNEWKETDQKIIVMEAKLNGK